jgi:hypothetical protein
MEPQIDQIWEWILDRTHINVFRVQEISRSCHECRVTCEIIDGEEPGSIFTTDIGSFNNSNWRCIKQL